MADVLQPGRGCEIPVGEVSWRFSTSSGPGGQHANRANTRVECRLDLLECRGPTDDQRQRLVTSLGHEVVVSTDQTRSQHRNRAIALERLELKLARALQPPKRRRPPKGPSKSSKRRRLDAKKRKGALKRSRSGSWD